MRVFITVTADHALDRARAAEKEIAGGHRLPLQGVPISLKDLFDTKGIRTTAGTKILADRIPAEDATATQKLNNAGAVLVGKTNMHEFAFGPTSVNPHYGTPCNPWDPERIPGGSSGGSATAVALALGFGALGSDTGGSIRIPSSACGIAGLKPTYGRASLHGVIPLSWSLDHPGPMARTVEDVAILLGVIAGYDPRDPRSQDVPIPDYTKALTGNIKGVRVGVPKTYFFDRVAAEVDTAVKTALRNIEKLGAQMVEVDLARLPLQQEIFTPIVVPEAYAWHEHYLEKQADLYGDDVRARIEPGRSMLSVDYVRAQQARMIMKEEFKEVFRTIDVIVSPTLPIPAPRIDRLLQPWGDDPETANASLTRFTRPFNIAGCPAISIPCGFTAGGLPIGMQIGGKPFDEANVLRVAHAYEQDAMWFERRPPM